MKINYDTILSSFVLFFLLPVNMCGQELKIQRVTDFDLKGNVKQCVVITDYGKEEYNFNEKGMLVKSVTRFSDSDYSVTHYKYDNDLLLEKRLENYIGGEFDKGTSIAHIFKIDTSGNKKITENILTYSKKFLDQYIYKYDDEDKLVSIKRINNEEIDETEITYLENKGEFTQTFVLNKVPYKSIRTSTVNNKEQTKITLTKEFIKGKPHRATEVKTDTIGRTVKKIFFELTPKSKGLSVVKEEFYMYDNVSGALTKIITKRGNATSEKNYIHQFDGDNGNWIKQIVAPENTYSTRKIMYYEKPKVDTVEEKE